MLPVDSHNLRILFFVKVELYLFAVVPHFCKNTTNVLLLCFRNGTALSFDMIIFRAEVRYNFVFDTMKIGGAYVIENLRYSPGVDLSTVVVEESARLIVRYYGLIDGSVGSHEVYRQAFCRRYDAYSRLPDCSLCRYNGRSCEATVDILYLS